MSVIENKEGELYFLVKADLALVVEHRSKIERLFSVTLLLDVQLLANQSHWIGVKGDSRDRLNAKIYILSLVNCPDSVCNEEKKIYLPPEVGVDVIETVERRTTAVIISENLVERLYLVRGSKLSVTAALTAIEEVIERDSLKHHGEFTPKRLNKASRRLSCALQETLTKKNQRGNYVNTSDAVKRAIASCLIEESEKPSDDDDVILIEDNSDEDIEPIVIDDDDDDDDVIFIDTPKPRQDQTDQSDGVFFNDKENEPANSKSVEQLTKAFSDMKTPSKSMLKSTKLSEKTKVPIKPLNFNQLNDDDNIEVFLTFEETAVKEKEVKKKKKKHKRKRAKKRTASKIEDDTVGSITVNGNAIVREGKKFLPEENENLPKRQRIKSAVVKPDSNVDNLCETEVKGVQNGAQVRCRGKVSLSPVVFNRFPTQRVQPMFQHEEKGNKKDTNEEKTMSDITEKRKGKKNFSDIVRDNLVNKATATDNSKHSYQPQVTKNFKQMSRTKNTDLVDGKVMINSSQGKHQGVHVNDSSSKDKVSVSPRTTSARSRNDLRYIVIDGSNVAMAHGIDKFSCKGIKICVDYFRRRGHANITVFLPHWRKCRPLDPNSVTYRYVLDDLEKDGYLVYTPSRRIGRKLVASYDDRFVIELAEREDGIVVSNDQYRDLLHEKHSWRRVIETRLLMFTFVRDHFMLPDDPYGRDGPSLDELLRQSTTKSAIPRDRDMLSTLKCLEMNNRSCDPREAERDFYAYRGIRY